jgi:Icc-related predicted phosphoesterase
MKIWHISDTHMAHETLEIPEGIDLVIHSGDASNKRHPGLNEPEMRKFLDWFSELPMKYKIFCAGNHDTSIERGLVRSDDIERMGIAYLYNDSIMINGFKIWGSPYVPTYGNWAFMKSRQTINRVWDNIPDDTDILVTHGPPKGILDSTIRRGNTYDLCGDSSLLKRVMNLNLKLMCFGHIHNTKDIYNSGTRTMCGKKTIFSNGACATDGKFGILTSNGNILDIK